MNVRKSTRTGILLLVAMVATVVFSATAEAQITATCNGVTATIVGTSGADNIVGTEGDDVIVSFNGDDVIDSGEGNDLICSGAGNDTVNAGWGANEVLAGAGDDNVYVEGAGRVLAGGGNDQIDFEGHVYFGEEIYVHAGAGDDTVVILDTDGEGGIGQSARVLGANGRDRLYFFTSADVTFYGGNGEDELLDEGAVDAYVGNLRAFGGAGQDFMVAPVNAVSVFINGGSGEDILGSNNPDWDVRGGADTDYLVGTGINGSGGDDFLAMPAEANGGFVRGGGGDDQILAAGTSGNVQGNAAQDLLLATETFSGTLNGGSDSDLCSVGDFDRRNCEQDDVEHPIDASDIQEFALLLDLYSWWYLEG